MLLCLQLTRNVLFNRNMDNFKFNFLSRGQLESLNLDRIFLPLFKVSPCKEDFFVTKFWPILPLLLECCAEIILSSLMNCSSLTSFAQTCFTNVIPALIINNFILLKNQLDYFRTCSSHVDHKAAIIHFFRESGGPDPYQTLRSGLK